MLRVYFIAVFFFYNLLPVSSPRFLMIVFYLECFTIKIRFIFEEVFITQFSLYFYLFKIFFKPMKYVPIRYLYQLLMIIWFCTQNNYSLPFYSWNHLSKSDDSFKDTVVQYFYYLLLCKQKRMICIKSSLTLVVLLGLQNLSLSLGHIIDARTRSFLKLLFVQVNLVWFK